MGEKTGVDKKLTGLQRERSTSLGNIEEWANRKRKIDKEKMEEELDAFKRSNATSRSPEHREKMKEAGNEGEDREIGDSMVGGEGMKDMKDWKNEMEGILKEMVALKGWREDFRLMREEVKDGIRSQGELFREELEKFKEEFREQEMNWRKEREEMRQTIRMLEQKIEEVREEKERERDGGKVRVGGGADTEQRLERLERRIEMNDRIERRKNIIIKGLEVKEGRRREAVEELLNVIGAKVEIKETRKIGRGGEGKEGEIAWVRLGSEEQKREVWEKKKMLRGRKERITDDLTWKERRMRWKLEEIAREEERKGKRVWISYGKLKIDGIWWGWDENEEVLKIWESNGRLEGKGKRGNKKTEQGEGNVE